jgi:four helix bundle suffix protein
MTQPGFIPKFGGYEKLLSYQKARVVYKGTVYFIKRWVPRFSRTTDQMEQAARSGKQNIVEGSLASAVSKETEVKLTGVALASLGELLEDYRDFLYVRDLDEWTPAHPYVRRLSQLCRTPGADYETFRKGIEHDDPAICANVLGGLTRVTIRLLNGQLDRLERDFVTEGGLRERMTRARLEFRDRAAAHERQRAALRPSLKVPSVPLVPSKRPTPMTQSPHN